MEVCLVKENENNFVLKQSWLFQNVKEENEGKTINRKLRGKRKIKKERGEKRGNLMWSSWLKTELLWQEFKN